MKAVEYPYEDAIALKEALEAEIERLSALIEDAEAIIGNAKASLEEIRAKTKAIGRNGPKGKRERKCYRVEDRIFGKTYLEPTREDAERRLQEIAWANPGKRTEFRYSEESGTYTIKERKE